MSEIIAWFIIHYPDMKVKMQKCSHSNSSSEVNPYHIEDDCWSHTMMVCKMVELRSADRALMVAALLHDIGKPEVRRVNPRNNHVQFFGHEEKSALLAKPIVMGLVLQGFLSQDEADEALGLIAMHGYFYGCKDANEAYVFFAEKRAFFSKLTLLVECDHLGRFGSPEVEQSFGKIKEIIERIKYLLEQK
jgi:putative nucleotidyltransferase with HDIG domain